MAGAVYDRVPAGKLTSLVRASFLTPFLDLTWNLALQREHCMSYVGVPVGRANIFPPHLLPQRPFFIGQRNLRHSFSARFHNRDIISVVNVIEKS